MNCAKRYNFDCKNPLQGKSGPVLTESRKPMIAHVIYRLDVGGLENGLVNLLNSPDLAHLDHAIICIDTHTEFRDRIQRDDIEVFSIHKRPGHDLAAVLRMARLFRQLKPDLVHTRNMAALDALLPAWSAGVRVRIHGEHGWGMDDVGGKNRKDKFIRRLFSPLVTEYVALSQHQVDYLIADIRVANSRITKICNGVDTSVYFPVSDNREARKAVGDDVPDSAILIGSVGRIEPVKNHVLLLNAIKRLVEVHPSLEDRVRLLIVGGGSLESKLRDLACEKRISNLVLWKGQTNGVSRLMQAMDIYVQPSLAEGISNTILEAMASGLPVIASTVGGNSELVYDGQTGFLVPPNQLQPMVDRIMHYIKNREKRLNHGSAARQRTLDQFSLKGMTRQYQDLYGRFLEVESRPKIEN